MAAEVASADSGKHFLLEIIDCKDVPKSDLVGHSDPYVLGWFCNPSADSVIGRLGSSLEFATPDRLAMTQSSAKRSGFKALNLLKSKHPFTESELAEALKIKKGPQIRTERVYNTKDPLWMCVRDFHMVPNEEDMLVLALYDWDSSSKDDLLGATAIPVSILTKSHKKLTIEMTLFNKQTKGLGVCSLTLRSLPVPNPYPTRKTLFLIRHGESRWNEAQEKKNLGDMMSTTDHGLNVVGIEQARGFNARWKRSGAASGERAAKFLAATDIWVSPLTRAVQTSLLTLDGHPTLARQGVKLLPSMREAKNIGGLDTIGKKFGEDIEARVRSQFHKVLPSEEHASLPLGHPIDWSRCVQPWWTPKGIKEGSKVIGRRLYDFATVMQLVSPADSIICVGHSLFFKQFVTNFMSDALRAAKPELAAKMVAQKLSNACCLAVDVVYSSDPEKPVQVLDAELMFDSTFLEE